MSQLTVDKSSETHLIRCSACPSWFALELSLLEAWQAGRGHERAAHPGSQQADAAIRQIERQQAQLVADIAAFAALDPRPASVGEARQRLGWGTDRVVRANAATGIVPRREERPRGAERVVITEADVALAEELSPPPSSARDLWERTGMGRNRAYYVMREWRERHGIPDPRVGPRLEAAA